MEESLGDPSALLQLAADNYAAERQAGCRKLRLAAAWADCFGAPPGLELGTDQTEPPQQSVMVERFVRMGAIGTPLVAESCPAELGHPHHSGPVASRRLMGDALTIRHRLPLLWQRIKNGEVWAWKARKIAERTSDLGMLSVRIVDRLVTPYLELMAWARFEKVLDATLLQVDQKTYQQRAEKAAAQRDVKAFAGEHGLRTLVAKLEAGDSSAFLALVERVAECLAEEGDDDPVGVRRSKAFGIIAHQARLRDLLSRHADAPHDLRHPEERVAAHADDPSDPWAADDLPSAGWETAAHGNYHQPCADDLDDRQDDRQDCAASPTEDDETGWSEDPLAEETDRAWFDERRDQPDSACAQDADSVDDRDAGGASCSTPATPVPAAFASGRDRRGACRSCGSTFNLRPLSTSELNACRTKAVVHVHVTDQTLVDQHGVLRTEDGPITLDQFRRWLTDSGASIAIRPVLDPAAVAAVDSYEIPAVMREALHTRHPGSIWPYSSVTEIATGGRLDLDHNAAYVKGGPPGQTAVGKLGPVARSEHRPKTVGGWQVRQPDIGAHVWRSPHGWISVVTNQGTLMLGDSPWAHRVWDGARTALAC